MLKNFKYLICISLIVFGSPVFSLTEQPTTLSARIFLEEQIPTELMGTWRVVSKLAQTDAPENFKKMGVDLWNLSKSGNVINLCNPMTGASASINIELVRGNTIRFTKEGVYDNQKLTDTVEITLEGNKFSGVNNLKLQRYSSVDNSIVSEKTATYNLQGDKISGENVLER